MNDRDALWTTILSEPENDTPRLALADWLEEEPQSRTCRACGFGLEPGTYAYPTNRYGRCRACNGKGILDTANADRAEFIRVGVRVAILLEGWNPDTWDNLDMYLDPQDRDVQEWKHEVRRLREREKELLRRYGRTWRRGPVCGACEGKGTLLGCAGDRHNPTCPDCDGTGYAGSLAATFGVTDLRGRRTSECWSVEATFTRGFVSRVELPVAAFLAGATRRRDGRDDSFAARLFREWPVTEVVLGREPDPGAHTAPSWTWWEDDRDPAEIAPDSLPSVLFDRLDAIPVTDWGEMRKTFDTRERALAALSDAAVRHGRAAAGLAPLPHA